MKRKPILVFLPILLLACNAVRIPVTSDAPTQNSPAISSTALSSDLTLMYLHPKDGDLKTMLATESQKAVAIGQIPVVEFEATWCPSCNAVNKALNEKNGLMMKAYAGVYLIKLDTDEWGWKFSRVELFKFDAIPVYFKLDPQGKPTGEKIDGGAWGEDIPENIAPVMDKFFHGG